MTRASGSTKLTLTMLALLGVGSLTGCMTAPSDGAICDASAALRDAHTEALLSDGGDMSVLTGSRLIAALDAACES